MLDRAVFGLVFAAAIGSGIVGGIFYGFSSFVMTALGRLPAEQGALAMKTINVTVVNPSFMIVFWGTVLACLVLGIGSLFTWSQTSAKLALAASLLYLIGCLGVTVACNVPLNAQLADAVEPAQTAAFWGRYLDVWTVWNHVRMVASLSSSILFICALRLI